MDDRSSFIGTIGRAIVRARYAIISVAGTYAVSIVVGIILVHMGNAYSLSFRDQLVGQANQPDNAIMQASDQGDNLKAALLDAGGNLLQSAVPKTVMGLGVVFPYPLVAFQGWVGGIVSVRNDHSSRFNDPRSAAYLLITLILQIIPFSLATGAGVNVGVSMFRPAPCYQGEKLLGLFPKEALFDVGRIYLLVVPLFLVASLFEFMSPWNI
jgi:uncharacterized membrane protein SpoIIM required for sporulation